MHDVLVLIVHLIITTIRLMQPGDARSVVAESVLAMSKRLFRYLGFDVLLAADEREALEVFQRQAQAISFVILVIVLFVHCVRNV